MTEQDRYLSDTLHSVASKHFGDCREGFKSLEHFEECVTCCHFIIARRYGHEWNSEFGKGTSPFANHLPLPVLGGCEIPREDFADTLDRFRTSDGVQHRPPYKACLDALADENIIHVCNSYSNDPKHPFRKKYNLHNQFVRAVLLHYQSVNPPGDFDIYSAVCGPYPKSLLASKCRIAKRLYNHLGEINGMRLNLPHGWDESYDEKGQLDFNPDLSLDTLIHEMKLFKDQKDYGDKHGRHYDWFTSCSSSFRKYLFVGDKHYREIVDCPSGAFWMLTIDGFRKGAIPYQEASRLVGDCFTGNFYSDVAGEPKTRLIKQLFMRVIASNQRQFNAFSSNQTFKKIYTALSDKYPNFCKYIQIVRDSCDDVGRWMHTASTCIEKDIIDRFMTLLSENGYTHLRRVHDAVYGIDEVSDAPHLLRRLALNTLHQS